MPSLKQRAHNATNLPALPPEGQGKNGVDGGEEAAAVDPRMVLQPLFRHSEPRRPQSTRDQEVTQDP